MTVTTEIPKASFRFDMLWNDSRYRSTFLQIVALILVMLTVLYLFNNVVTNLAALGKEFSFGFMANPSSYDINQRLIDYTLQSSHSTAAVVGILNTLLVAVMGCITATILGVLAGVLRLSKNWIVAKLMTCYIEGVRNVPVLIQILLYSAAFDAALPSPRQAVPLMDGFFVPTNRGFYFPQPVFEDGSAYIVLVLLAAIACAVRFGRYARKLQQQTGQHLPVFPVQAGLIILAPLAIYTVLAILAFSNVQICREVTVALLDGAGNPLLDAAGNPLLRCAVPIWLEFPELRGFNFEGGLYARNSLMALWMALSIYTGAFIAENVRAGIQAVSHGQSEAAFALGLRPGRTMSLIVLPQALRVIIPPLISQYLNLTKNSSLALAVGYMDATGTLGGITLNQTGKEMETLLLLMTFYLSISLSISFVMNLYNEQVKLVERTSVTGGGFSVLALFAAANGKWEMLKKGDAKMHDNYGVAGWLNLVVLLYFATFVMMLYYLFLDPNRDSYYLWSYPHQLVSLLLAIFAGATMITCLFKSYRVIDMAVAELAMFLLAAVLGLPFGEMTLGLAGTSAVVFGGVAARMASIGYIVFAARPNVTFFHRARAGATS